MRQCERKGRRPTSGRARWCSLLPDKTRVPTWVLSHCGLCSSATVTVSLPPCELLPDLSLSSPILRFVLDDETYKSGCVVVWTMDPKFEPKEAGEEILQVVSFPVKDEGGDGCVGR
ncbi:hypothetical protein Tsubulata_020581 [Turnera subulata]|uniref:Uncharacterized protein n=1 Tax=Turnera subulata TaxID=218843 RepID=A0A9Q0GAD1_9ROSI|nr:hypothetical protein Tsubulata_020581 [Turnera subulata]